jgi:mRNA interferase RelE/StbE
MGNYKIFFRKSVESDFKKVSKSDLQRIMKRIHLLTENPRPHGCEKLSGQDRYRSFRLFMVEASLCPILSSAP